MMTRKNLVVLGVGVFTLLLLTAGASAYVARNVIDGPKTEKVSQARTEKITWNEPRRQAPQPAPARQCDDGNIVGTAIGAVGGGLVGHQIGGGKGKDLATIGGAVAGGFAGHEYIPTHNALCP